MEFAVVGDGPRTLLLLPGGPGSELSTGLLAKLEVRQVRPYLESGYAVWSLTRRRHMAAGTSVADMASDTAAFIREQMGGRVDVVLGQSYGGIIALLLAADHPAVVRRVVAAGAAATISGWGRELDVRWAGHRAAGRHSEAGATMLEYVLPDARWSRLRRTLGPLVGSVFRNSPVPAGDLLVEAEAERVFDARDALGRITVPVLLICGGADRFFPPSAIRETADAIADCTAVTYPGLGHVRTLSSRRLPRDVLAWLESPA
jgi:pimeloyl-ACP methyl ester carboxylesterase